MVELIQESNKKNDSRGTKFRFSFAGFVIAYIVWGLFVSLAIIGIGHGTVGVLGGSVGIIWGINWLLNPWLFYIPHVIMFGILIFLLTKSVINIWMFQKTTSYFDKKWFWLCSGYIVLMFVWSEILFRVNAARLLAISGQLILHWPRYHLPIYRLARNWENNWQQYRLTPIQFHLPLYRIRLPWDHNPWYHSGYHHVSTHNSSWGGFVFHAWTFADVLFMGQVFLSVALMVLIIIYLVYRKCVKK